VTLCDSGPLVALIDRTDAHHAQCVATLATLPGGGLLTTWACLTEAMYLLYGGLGWRGQDELWGYVSDGLLRLHATEDNEWERVRELMRTYADTPMDLADASLVAAAEALRQRRVFTIDSDFYVYRQRQGHAFEVVP
jgi:predicted nucleic acid-binding protein